MDTESGSSVVTVVLQERKSELAMSGETAKLLREDELLFKGASKPELGCLFRKRSAAVKEPSPYGWLKVTNAAPSRDGGRG